MTARTFRYALVVEGWPEIFITDPSLASELSGEADGRAFVGGLSHQGLRMSERIIPLEGKIQASGMTFKIVPTGNTRLSDVSSTDPATAALSTYPDRLSRLTADWAYNDTAAPTVESVALDDGTVYHIGTEAIRVGTPYERNVWNTQAQSHYTESWFYERPPSMEGRRCFLYSYDNAGSGAIAWRGVVSTQPRLERDCVTWSIQTQPITHLLKQTIGGGFGEAQPMALYFSWRSAFYGRVWLGDNPHSTTDSYEFKITGLHTEQSLSDAVGIQFAFALSSTGADAYFSSIQLVKTPDGWAVQAFRLAGAGTLATSIGVSVGSFLTGFANTVGGRDPDQWVHQTGSVAGASKPMADPGIYTLTLNEWSMPWGQYEYSGGAGSVLGWAPGAPTADDTTDPLVSGTWPENRIYLNVNLAGAGAVHFEDVFDSGAVFAGVTTKHVYNVSGTGTTTEPVSGIVFNYIEIEGVPSFTSPFIMAVNADSKCKVIRSYSQSGSVVDFVNGLIALSVEANRGDTPFLTAADFATPLSLADIGLGPDILERQYAFTKQVTVEDVLARELQLASHMMRLAADGRIEFVPIAVPTYGTAEYSFDHSNIITPPDGEWPTSEPQRDGIVTSVTVQQQYDAIEDKWTDNPFVIQDSDSVSTHKNRGRGKVEIKTYSTPVNKPTYAFIKALGDRFLSFAGREYVIVTIRVTHDYRAVLCGMNVELTHRAIPDGNGRRGVIGVPGVVIERAWDLDPASKSMGDLTIWTAAKSLGGYCPSGLATGYVDNGGDSWTISFSAANPVNIDLSVAYDGDITRSFDVGDQVVITQINDATPTEVAGQVTAVSGDTLTVQFAGTWVPGSDAWVLLYAAADVVVGDQLRQVFMADSSLVSDAGGRRYYV